MENRKQRIVTISILKHSPEMNYLNSLMSLKIERPKVFGELCREIKTFHKIYTRDKIPDSYVVAIKIKNDLNEFYSDTWLSREDYINIINQPILA